MDSGTGLLGNFLNSSLGEHMDLHTQLVGSDPTSILGVPLAHLEEHRSLTPTQVPGDLLQSPSRASSFIP